MDSLGSSIKYGFLLHEIVKYTFFLLHLLHLIESSTIYYRTVSQIRVILLVRGGYWCKGLIREQNAPYLLVCSIPTRVLLWLCRSLLSTNSILSSSILIYSK